MAAAVGKFPREATAAFAYTARTPAELSVKAGEALVLLKPHNDVWLLVRGSAGEGHIPSNYVREAGAPATAAAAAAAPGQGPAAAAAAAATAGGSVAGLCVSIGFKDPLSRPRPPPPFGC